MGTANAWRLGVCALVLSALFGCERPCVNEPPESAGASSGQSYDQAIALMCDVDHRAAIGDVDPIERATRRSDYIVEHVKNPDGIEFRTLWSVKPTPDQARVLKSEAERVGLRRCVLADALARE